MKKFLAVLMAVLLVGSLTACGGSDKEAAPENAEGEAASDSDITIGVVLKTLSSEYWGYVAAGIEDAEADLGVNVELQGPPTETSYDEWNNMVETMLGTGNLDAIVLSPLQPESLQSVVGETDVPVIFVDTDAEHSSKVSYVGTSNYDAAYMGAEYAAELIGEGGKAVIIAGVEGNPSSDEREAGYKDALEAGGVTVEAVQYAKGLADEAASIMENLLTSLNNDIDVVLATNDDMAAGAAKSIEQAGLLGETAIIGFNGDMAAVESIVEGQITATVAQAAYEMGYVSVETAVKVAKGETVDEVIVTEANLVDSENAEEHLARLKEMLEQ